MASGRATAQPAAGALSRLGAAAGRHPRLSAAICVIAMAATFAAAGILHANRDALAANEEAIQLETQRAHDIAAVAATSLQHFERAGRAFAEGDLALSSVPGVRGFALSDRGGEIQRAAGEPIDMTSLADLVRSAPVVLGAGGRTVLAFPDDGEIVAVSFDTAALVPAQLLAGANLETQRGVPIAGRRATGQSVIARAGQFPLIARAHVADADAAWSASLPLTLFLIIGPTLMGASLAVAFLFEFERRKRAEQRMRVLHAERPADAELLVRLAVAERDAVEAKRAKSEFIAHMSHELRTPLNAIIGFAEVIERGLFGPAGHPKYVEYVRDISTSGRALHAKIGDILEFAEVEAERHPLDPKCFDVTDIASALVSEHAGRAFARHIGLDMVPAPPAFVMADKQAVRRILSNLLSNALAYTPEGGHVRLVVREETGAIAIGVSDDGGGFSAEESDGAGDAFRRFDRAGVSTGIGLGLAVVVALARRMGGAVKLSSVQGRGTSAEVRLPKAADQAAPSMAEHITRFRAAG